LKEIQRAEEMESQLNTMMKEEKSTILTVIANSREG
jgi:hypothetical protein